MALDRNNVMAALKTVNDPDLFKDIVTLNMVKDVKLDGDRVHVHVELTTPACPSKDVIQKDVERAVKGAGAREVTIEFSANTRGSQQKKDVLPQVKNVIAVGAGKGGVGKSTIALNIAVGLARTGAKVGLMDGDIYGPSMPTMLGIKGLQPQVRGPVMVPFFVHGIYAITIGSIVGQDQPLIWRGPMAHGAFKQLLVEKTEWPDLDYLVVDLPPGTGDVPLTLCQLLPLTGAVIVATPQQVALDDAVRALRMFEQLNTPILGIVENMSYLITADGQEIDIFGRGGAEKAAQGLGVPFLGALPMFPELRVNSDSGKPGLNFEGTPKLRDSLQNIVMNLAGQISIRNMKVAAPELEIT